MKIAYLEWKCFNGEATKKEMKEQGYEVLPFFHEGYNDPTSQEFVDYFLAFVKEKNPDIIFSYNFFPPVAEGAHQAGILYVSVNYDSPYVYLYSYTMMYDTNRVYLFDSDWVRELNAGGLTNVFYTVLPGNVNTPAKTGDYSCDLSFVGALYNEEHNFYSRMEPKLAPYIKGYLEGLMNAQHLVYGSDIIRPALTADVLNELHQALPLDPDQTCAEPPYYRFLTYVIDRKLTSNERIRYLSILGDRFGKDHELNLYTLDAKARFRGIKNCGIAEYNTIMPQVFNQSRINLNITLRSITSGIPQRCIDIMADGGFLLTNYQQDFFLDTLTDDGSAAFIPGADYDYYSSEEELADKVTYYLNHDDERKEIARNGHEKVKKFYSLEKMLKRVIV